MLVESIYRTCITNWVAGSDGYIVIIIVIIYIHGLGRGGMCDSCIHAIGIGIGIGIGIDMGRRFHTLSIRRYLRRLIRHVLIPYLAIQWDPASLTQHLVLDRKW